MSTPLNNTILWTRSETVAGGQPALWSKPFKEVLGGGTTNTQISAVAHVAGGDLVLARRGLDSQIYVMSNFTKQLKPNPFATWQAIQPPLFTTQAVATVQPANLNCLVFARGLDSHIYWRGVLGIDPWQEVPGATTANGLAACPYFVSSTDQGVLLFTRFSDNKIYCNRRDFV